MTINDFALELLESFIKGNDCLLALFSLRTVNMCDDSIAEQLFALTIVVIVRLRLLKLLRNRFLLLLHYL